MKSQASDTMHIIGIITRTTNNDEMAGAGKISGLWQRFYSEQLQQKIPDQLNQNVFAVYHSYESDATGPYSLLIGVQVKPETKVPEGLTSLKIPAAKYSVYTTEKGPMPDVVVSTWMSIWQDEAQQKLKRSYTYDFEVYDARAADPKASQVDIFIATS